MTQQGHNSVAADELRAFIERIEHAEDEVSLARENVKEIYAEAKGCGFDTKVVRKLIAIRKRNPDDIAEEQAILELYGSALGMEIFG